ncbi:hypothetical protein DENSPDRAFT_423774 [Dentipellis sp. KUC8613]|nr:hypothetical protein DENSPDRAFT_423774 [Dentipellis sp. KUC8613]
MPIPMNRTPTASHGFGLLCLSRDEVCVSASKAGSEEISVANRPAPHVPLLWNRYASAYDARCIITRGPLAYRGPCGQMHASAPDRGGRSRLAQQSHSPTSSSLRHASASANRPRQARTWCASNLCSPKSPARAVNRSHPHAAECTPPANSPCFFALSALLPLDDTPFRSHRRRCAGLRASR